MTDLLSNDAVCVQIERVLPFGLLVRLPDGREGLIREREVSWNTRQGKGWHEGFKPGDSLNAIVLSEGHDQRIELSLRLAESDPWEQITERYPLGRQVDGIVTGVQPYGAFVELAPGITGLLHVTRLPHGVQHEELHNLFWVGDRVRVTVERIDSGHRRIGLSLTRALLKRWNINWAKAEIDTQSTPSGALSERDLAGGTSTPQPHPSQEPTWQIVVVEDDDDYRTMLVRWLQRGGHAVRSAATAEDGLSLIEAEQPDLLISDWGLPHMSGAEAVMQARQRWPKLRCALMTDWTRRTESLEAFEEVRGNGIPVLIKPLRPDDIAAVLLEQPVDPRAQTPSSLDVDAVDPGILDMLQAALPAREQISSLLHRLRRRARAAKVVLFALNVGRRAVEIVAEVGATPLNLGRLGDLIFSPVRDVAEDGRTFRVDSAQQVESRVRYLQPLLAFHACLGLPLPVQLPERYALFLFFTHEREPDQQIEEYSAAVVLTLAVLLERENFRARALDTQRLALLGQLSRALVHEVNHRLSPVNFVLTEITQLMENLKEAQSGPSEIQRDLRHLHESVADLSIGIHRLTETAKMFGHVMVQSREQTVRLDQALREAIELTRDMADRSKVHMRLLVAENLPLVDVPIVHVQQMFLNLLVNAVQQIHCSAPAQGGHILVRAEPAIIEGDAVIRIMIEDDGPGIHRQLWERVFELGFTTRSEGGSGLGLYITRSLADVLGAKVWIRESLMLWGTTFVIDLPIARGRHELGQHKPAGPALPVTPPQHKEATHAPPAYP